MVKTRKNMYSAYWVNICSDEKGVEKTVRACHQQVFHVDLCANRIILFELGDLDGREQY